jgi:hypothetical protein
MAIKELTLTFSTLGAMAVSQTRGMEYNDRGFDKSTSMVKLVVVGRGIKSTAVKRSVVRHVGDGDGFAQSNVN